MHVVQKGAARAAVVGEAVKEPAGKILVISWEVSADLGDCRL